MLELKELIGLGTLLAIFFTPFILAILGRKKR